MSILDKMHKDWHPLMNLLHQEPLLTLKNDILPNISYQPKQENIFNVFSVPISSIKVVILGQDPFPTHGDAVGLSFLNGNKNKIPVSLRNIYKEIVDSNNITNPDIYEWQKQGVFLLNTALTVKTGNAGSHLEYWKDFTKKVINIISLQQPCIWLLWGKKAQDFRHHIVYNNLLVNHDDETINDIPISDFNYILQAPHPAAEAYSGGKAGFFGCNHFKYTNIILKKKGINEIKW